jgi:hypothetical protein
MKAILFLVLASVFFTAAVSQTVGSKVSFPAANGSTYTGIITEVQGNKYKVKYDGFDFEAWLESNQFTVVNALPPSPPVKNTAAGKLKVGDRVECDKAAINSWEKGTIMPFLKNDVDDGSTYRVRIDVQARNGMYLEGIEIPVHRVRLLPNEPAYQPEKTAVTVGKATVDANNTLSADRPIQQCPVQQTTVAANASPNTELLKKIIRCKKGESAASKGYDGAVTVDVTAIQIGTPRKWSYAQDIGNGSIGVTNVYPVKATYTVKTFYRSRTEVSENWIRIFNFYVNAFGEWASGSEENVQAGVTKNIPRD